MKKEIYHKPYSIRISLEAKEKIVVERKQSGLSWNKFVLSLIDKDYKKKIYDK